MKDIRSMTGSELVNDLHDECIKIQKAAMQGICITLEMVARRNAIQSELVRRIDVPKITRFTHMPLADLLAEYEADVRFTTRRAIDGERIDWTERELKQIRAEIHRRLNVPLTESLYCEHCRAAGHTCHPGGDD